MKEIKFKVNVDTKDSQKDVENLNENLKQTSDDTKDAGVSAGLMGTSFGKMATAALGGLKKVILSFKTLKGAIASTGIGLILIAFAALVQFFTKSEKGAQKLRVITAVLGNIMDKLTDILIKAGEILFDLFSKPQESIKKFANLIKEIIVNRFVGLLELIPNLGKAIGLLFKGKLKEAAIVAGDAMIKVTLGVDKFSEKVIEATEAAKKYAKEMANVIKQSIILENRANALKVANRNALVEEAKLRVELADARIKMNNSLLTEEERLIAANQAININNKLYDGRIKRKQEEYDLMVETNKLATTGEKDMEAEAQLEKELIELTARMNTENIKFYTKKSTLIKKSQADAQKELDIQQDNYDKLKDYRDNNNLSEINDADELFKAKLKLQKESEIKSLDSLKLNEELKQQFVQEINSKYQTLNEENDTANVEKELERKQEYYNTLNNLKEENYLNNFENDFEKREAEIELDKQYFEEDLQRKIEQGELTSAEALKISDEYNKIYLKNIVDTANAETLFNKLKLQGKIDAAANTAKSLIDLGTAAFGESKAASIAATLITTYQSATAAFNAMAGIPVVGPGLGIAAASMATVAGMKTLSKIKSTDKPKSNVPTPRKLATGGVIGGQSFTSDSIPVMVNSAEVVLNPMQQANLLFSMANNREDNNNITANDVVNIVSSIPVNVIESDITDLQRKVKIRENLFTN